MSAMIGVRAMELLVSRLCHDLVGPVGAINNGVELIGETGLADGGEAFDLIADSGEVAARRLKMFRLAFGAAGAENTMGLGDLRAVLDGWLRGGKIRFVWNVMAMPEVPGGFFKLILTTAMLAEEAMPQGGSLTLTAGTNGVRFAGEGSAAAFRDEVRQALDGTVAEDDLTPRAVLAHVAGRMAVAYGLTLWMEPAETNRIAIRVLSGD